jgi:dipeptidyl aminopeptidase/acylaminoacyl peptidase
MPGDAPFVDARKWTLIAVDVGTGKNHVLTPQPVVLKNFALSPDGTRVLYKAVVPQTVMLFRRETLQEWLVSTQGGQAPQPILERRTPSWVVFSTNNRELVFPEKGRLCSVNISDRRERVLLDKIPEQTREPRVASSGWLAFLAARPGTVPEDSKMYTIVEPTWDVFVTQLSQPKARTLADAEVQAQNSDLTWSADGRTLFYRSVDQQSYRETIRRWSTGGARTENVYASDQTIRGINVTHDGSRVLFSAQSAASPEDGYLLSAGKSVPQRVTDLNPQLAAFAFQVPKIIRFYSVDGNALDALLYLPAYASADQPVPVITYIYEKLSQFKNHFESEAQWYVSHGYGYLMPDVLVNPGFLSESYVKCVVPAVNAARAMGLTTGSFGVTGRSLGGIAGLSLISRSDVFAAAVLLAPPSDFFSTWADGRDRDIWTIETGQGRAGGTPWERHDRYIDNSPFFFADRVHTPVLIIHGKADFTVPFQQGMMMFSALRALHRSADLLIYRDADHSIVRGSRFRFIDLHQRTMEWWERYLRTNPEEKTKAATR